MSNISKHLLETDLFRIETGSMSEGEKIALAYKRARAIARAYDFTAKDIAALSPKFWTYHRDLINPADMAAFTLITIQYNLAAGTLAPFIEKRPDLQELMDKILSFEVSAQFLLTEVGHGLDAKNLETTATLLANGDFELHTPTRRAAKYMPPTSPQPGFPRVAIVMARLIVEGEDRGIRPFIVWLNDGYHMCRGVHARVLPRRAGSKPLDHSITSFCHVRLPSTALLGEINDSPDFHTTIHRVHIGTLALSTVLIPQLQHAVYVAGKYSLRRHITDPSGITKPIASFRTQQAPILHCIAQIKVYDAFANECTRIFMDNNIQYSVRHGIAATFKAVVTHASQETLYALAERCGAQGLFEYNGIIESQLTARGISIAEGDMLVLTILKAVGNRLAYEAALDAGVDRDILDLYEAGVLLQSPDLGVDEIGIILSGRIHMERLAMNAISRRLEQLLDSIGAEPYITAPILTEESWEAFLDKLPQYGEKPYIGDIDAAASSRL
ncbi:acyl-CoA oxidase [Talaromyces pinophilus]|uniref:Acyl-CoA oxidase n=1 Tax=Talaromyces pinophilus TaxID=128442 RepID=A0A0B8N392_TALPI|nr:acyl-CoA oxidase [Talaromyces pinophilus]